MTARAWMTAGRGVLTTVILGGALLAGSGAAVADQTDPRLDSLFERLRATADVAEARSVESRIWALWLESGDPDVDAMLRDGISAMERGDLGVALEHFDRVVEAAPAFAEGWNKRATVLFLLGDLTGSVEDVRRTLALEPRHFGAVSGLGLIFMQKGDALGAIGAFERVLEIDPHAPGARANIELLRRAGRGIGA